MEKIKKEFNPNKIISFLLAQVFLCANVAYSADMLRVPVGSGLERTAIVVNKRTTRLNMANWFKGVLDPSIPVKYYEVKDSVPELEPRLYKTPLLQGVHQLVVNMRDIAIVILDPQDTMPSFSTKIVASCTAVIFQGFTREGKEFMGVGHIPQRSFIWQSPAKRSLSARVLRGMLDTFKREGASRIKLFVRYHAEFTDELESVVYDAAYETLLNRVRIIKIDEEKGERDDYFVDDSRIYRHTFSDATSKKGEPLKRFYDWGNLAERTVDPLTGKMNKTRQANGSILRPPMAFGTSASQQKLPDGRTLQDIYEQVPGFDPADFQNIFMGRGRAYVLENGHFEKGALKKYKKIKANQPVTLFFKFYKGDCVTYGVLHHSKSHINKYINENGDLKYEPDEYSGVFECRISVHPDFVHLKASLPQPAERGAYKLIADMLMRNFPGMRVTIDAGSKEQVKWFERDFNGAPNDLVIYFADNTTKTVSDGTKFIDALHEERILTDEKEISRIKRRYEQAESDVERRRVIINAIMLTSSYVREHFMNWLKPDALSFSGMTSCMIPMQGGDAIDKVSDSGEKILRRLKGEVFEKKGYVNTNALRRFLQEVALNVGLDSDKMRPVLIGSTVYFADKDGYVDIRIISDIDIWWETHMDLDRNEFQSSRSKFINELKRMLKGEMEKKEDWVHETSDNLFVYSPNNIKIKISISTIRGKDVIKTTMKGINRFLNMHKEEMRNIGLYRAVRRYMMILYYAKVYLNDSELEGRFNDFKTRLLVFSTDESASESGYGQLFEDVYTEVNRIKNNINNSQSRLTDAARQVLFGTSADFLIKSRTDL